MPSGVLGADLLQQLATMMTMWGDSSANEWANDILVKVKLRDLAIENGGGPSE